jgi:glutathione peroxidase
MYRDNKARGFEVLAFPANDFAQQEPGSDAEIKAFCSSRFSVSFPVFAKIVVKGNGKHPLYHALTTIWPYSRGIPGLPGTDFRSKLASHGIDVGPPHEVVWNFEKFLVDRTGHVVDRFAPDVPPDAKIINGAIQRALG